MEKAQLLRKSRLECLPAELQLEVFGCLEYPSTIMLFQTNIYFNATIDPQARPSAVKAAFVKKAQCWKKHDKNMHFYAGINEVKGTITVGYACFTCYRIRPMHAFAARQIIKCNKIGQRTHAAWNDLRCCIDCRIVENALRHRVTYRFLYKISTLLHDRWAGRDRINILNIKIMESKEMEYCGKCKAMHTLEQFDKSRCSIIKPSHKAIRRSHFGRYKRWGYTPVRSATRSILRRPKQLDLLCGICNAPAGKEYCPQCQHWVCWRHSLRFVWWNRHACSRHFGQPSRG